MTNPLTKASYEATEAELELMVLDSHQLPEEFRGFRLGREGEMDNDEMAKHGFPGNTGEGFRELGRITGYHREFVAPPTRRAPPEGSDIAVATVAHLFTDEDSVSSWMSDDFFRHIEENVGKSDGAYHRL